MEVEELLDFGDKEAEIVALSVKQPFASQIASGEKTVEYRSWPTSYRGALLIVSTKQPVVELLPSGCAVAVVDLVDCREAEEGKWDWILESPRPIEHFPVRGKQGLYGVRVSPNLLTDTNVLPNEQNLKEMI